LYDLLIKGGTIIDGTGTPGFVGDVLIDEGKVLAIGRLSSKAKRVIPADGLVVAPGFIDAHSHSDLKLFTDPLAKEKILQGVTTEVLGQDGLGVAPVPKAVQELQSFVEPLLGTLDAWEWQTIGEYLDALQQARPAVNACVHVPHGTIRMVVMGLGAKEATEDDLSAMASLIRQGMDEGAIGLSTGLIYAPAAFSDHRELVALCRAVAEKNGVFTTHMRSESTGVIENVQETIDIGKESGAHVHISHHKVSGMANWGKSKETLSLISMGRAQGQKITCDLYPYTAGCTMLRTLLPPWSLEKGTKGLLSYLADQSARTRIQQDLQTGLPGWDSVARAIGWDKIVVTNVGSYQGQKLEGLSLSQIAKIMAKEPIDALMDLLLIEEGQPSMITFQQDEEDMNRIMRYPYSVFCTDGIIMGGRPHPRLYGSFPRVLGHYVRERQLLSLEEAIRKMTSLPARLLSFNDIGRIRVGAMADVTIFDPDRITDKATYDDPKQHPEGINWVLVGGEVIVEEGEHTGKRCGRVLRKGR
jgi:N-acyl-D-amino-acid deacylase